MWVMKLNLLEYIHDRGADRLHEDKRSTVVHDSDLPRVELD